MLIPELELRDKRVTVLLNCGFIDAVTPPCLDGPLASAQSEYLRFLFRRAIGHCDRIADMSANMCYTATLSEELKAYYALMADGSWSITNTVLDPFRSSAIREYQIEYLHSLSVEDLTFLYFFACMAGLGFVRGKDYHESDPMIWEKITVFEESLLRHGSFFLWAYVKDKDIMHSVAVHTIMLGLAELTDWETGKENMKPGLRMNLVEAFRVKVGCEDDRTKIGRKMFEMVRKTLDEIN